MTRELPPARIPGIAIARVLRGIGLEQGTDFRVTKGAATNGCWVSVQTEFGHERVATFESTINERSAEAGFPFTVTVYTTPTGRVRTSISNIKRAVAPSTAPLDSLIDLIDEVDAEQAEVEALSTVADQAEVLAATIAQVTAKVDELNETLVGLRAMRARLMSASTAHPTPLDTERLNVQRYTFSSPGGGAFNDRIRAAWPEGTRVRGKDTEGRERTGHVDGYNVGYITLADHANYHRSHVGVTWDEIPGTWAVPRNIVFLDEIQAV